MQSVVKMEITMIKISKFKALSKKEIEEINRSNRTSWDSMVGEVASLLAISTEAADVLIEEVLGVNFFMQEKFLIPANVTGIEKMLDSRPKEPLYRFVRWYEISEHLGIEGKNYYALLKTSHALATEIVKKNRNTTRVEKARGTEICTKIL
jgi:hypothetical protein